MDRYTEIGAVDRYLLAHWQTRVESWLERGFVKLEGERLLPALFKAVSSVREHEAARLWQRLFDEPLPDWCSSGALAIALAAAARGPLVRLVVLERVVERSIPQAGEVPKVEAPKPRELAEVVRSVSLALVDEWGNPLGSIPYQLIPLDGAARAGSFPAAGEVIEAGLSTGDAQLELAEVHADEWALRTEPPIGWRQREIALKVVDAHGEPLAVNASFRIVFANGSGLSGTLDGQASTRREDAPSWPMRVEFPNYDVESWD